MDNDTGAEWRPIPGFEGLYEASSEGQIRATRRRGTRGGILKQAIDRSKPDYPRPYVNLCRDSKAKTHHVHRVIALAFHGPVPDGMETRHLDGNPENNRADNLRYGSKSENAYDRVRHGGHPNAAKTECLNGHPFDEENTYLQPSGRGCRKCRRRRQREHDIKVRTSTRPAR